jgi:protein TonB
LLGQIAGLETQAQRRANANVRSKRVNPSDTRSPEGFYIAAWVRKVEQIGEMNFPDVARKLNLSTGPVLDVAIRADGSLQDVRVIRSSGNAELDLAAQRIVKLGAPYAPFPSALRQQYDVLYISRPWRFEPGGRLRTR